MIRIVFRTLSSFALALALLVPQANADELLARYAAYLSPQDHVNSSGGKLTTGAQVLAQDRANLHRFSRPDSIDEWDSYFKTFERRSLMEALVERGYNNPAVLSDLVRFNLHVLVEVWRGPKSDYVHVEILP